MTQKAQSGRTDVDINKKTKSELKKTNNMRRERLSLLNSTSASPGSISFRSSPSGGYLLKEGDSMNGPLALESSQNFSITISSNNTIDIGSSGNRLQYSSNILLNSTQTNSYVLDIIANAAFDGQILIIKTFAPTTPFTIRQGTQDNGGNIQTENSNDITLGNLQILTLIFDRYLQIHGNTGGTWRVIGNTSRGGGGGSSGYSIIQDEGTAVTQRNTINFIGTGVSVTDNSDQSRTDVTIGGGAGATALNDLTDVTIDSVSNAQFLIYDSATSHWENQSISGNATISNSGSLTIRNNVIDNDNLIGGVFSKITGLGAQTRTLDMDGESINDISFLNSNAVNLPGSGFIRMGTGEAIRMRNRANNDDLIITSGTNSVGSQSINLQVAGGNQLTISELTLDVVDNSITNTGDITPGGGAHQVGDSTDFYNQMHSQFFIPEPASVISNRYGLSKVGNTLYANFDNINRDAGFSIYEEGLESFRFYHPTSNVNEFHMGSSTVFTSGETYRIQMGENNNSSAKIELIEGSNDLTLERQGVGTSFGVKLRSGGLDRLYARATDVLLSVPLNVNTNEITNVVNIKSNGDGDSSTGTIGELITGDGGFNYFVRDTIAWERNSNTEINFGASGIDILTNGSRDDIDITASGASSSINLVCTDTMLVSVTASTGINYLVSGASRFTIQDNSLVSTVDMFMGNNFVDYTETSRPSNPGSNHGRMYARDVSGVSVPFWLDQSGIETSMISGGGGGGANTSLSNLSSTRINQSLLPNNNRVIDLGSSTLNWRNIYTDAIRSNLDISLFASDDIILDTQDDLVIRNNGSVKMTYNGGNDNFVFNEDILLDNGSRIRSNDSTEIGLFVTNATSSVGSSGSNQCPTSSSIVPTFSNFETSFGSEIGCMGQFSRASLDFWVRKTSSDTWLAIIVGSTGTITSARYNR